MEMGVSVGVDFDVIGFDDIEEVKHTLPALSSAGQSPRSRFPRRPTFDAPYRKRRLRAGSRALSHDLGASQLRPGRRPSRPRKFSTSPSAAYCVSRRTASRSLSSRLALISSATSSPRPSFRCGSRKAFARWTLPCSTPRRSIFSFARQRTWLCELLCRTSLRGTACSAYAETRRRVSRQLPLPAATL